MVFRGYLGHFMELIMKRFYIQSLVLLAFVGSSMSAAENIKKLARRLSGGRLAPIAQIKVKEKDGQTTITFASETPLVQETANQLATVSAALYSLSGQLTQVSSPAMIKCAMRRQIDKMEPLVEQLQSSAISNTDKQCAAAYQTLFNNFVEQESQSIQTTWR